MVSRLRGRIRPSAVHSQPLVTEFDGGRFPRLVQYVQTLPEGLDSYPDCQIKASLYRALLDQVSLPSEVVEALPACLRALVEDPVPISGWVPTVRHMALRSAMCDVAFRSEEEFFQVTYDNQRALFRGPLYAILFRVGTPRLFIRGAGRRWTAFHRGTSLEVTSAQERSGSLSLTYPPHLWDTLGFGGLRSAFRATLELAGARDVVLEIEPVSPSLAHCVARWRSKNDPS